MYLDENDVCVIGDVHGCLEELFDLIKLIEARSVKPIKLYFLGDLIDRGPNTIGVLRFVTSHPWVAGVCLGNHEEKFFRWMKHQEKELAGGPKNPIKQYFEYPEELSYWLDLLANKIKAYIQIPDSNYTLVHGGFLPTMRNLPSQCLKELSKFDRLCLRVRYIDENGNMVRFGNEKPDHSFWTESYDGRFGTVVYGHQPVDEVVYKNNTFGIDTGCVFGGKLTALHLISNDEVEEISVIARQQYAEKQRPWINVKNVIV